MMVTLVRLGVGGAGALPGLTGVPCFDELSRIENF